MNSRSYLFYGYILPYQFCSPAWGSNLLEVEDWWPRWRAEPLPIEPILYCSGDDPRYGIAVPGTVTRIDEDNYARLNLNELPNAVKLDKCKDVVKFLEDFVIPLVEEEPEPGWFIVNYEE